MPRIKHSPLGPIFQAMEISARAIRIELQQFGGRGPDDMAGAFAAMTKSHADAVVVLNDGMLITKEKKTISGIAAKRRLPALGFDTLAEVGGLMSYGANLPALFRRGPYFVDGILKGAKPADLPVEQPTQFELFISRKTANALGIKFPQSMLVRATKVIK
ncbi:MAG: ABC transporter substrate binding protein [Burkholderiales bacterium]